MERLTKPWGWEEIVEQNENYVVKKLFMKKDHQCSLQLHEHKRETIYVLSGILTMVEKPDVDTITSKDYYTDSVITIPSYKIHRMRGRTDCLYLECSTPELDDVVRIEDDYGRAE